MLIYNNYQTEWREREREREAPLQCILVKPVCSLFTYATTPGVSYFAFYEAVLIHLEQHMKGSVTTSAFAKTLLYRNLKNK